MTAAMGGSAPRDAGTADAARRWRLHDDATFRNAGAVLQARLHAGDVITLGQPVMQVESVPTALWVEEGRG